MKINDKEFRDWTKEDIKALIENDVFRENNSIDYKVNFAMLECADKNLKKKKQAEFRNDICSFANSDGGYIFFGISEVSDCIVVIVSEETGSISIAKEGKLIRYADASILKNELIKAQDKEEVKPRRFLKGRGRNEKDVNETKDVSDK